MTISRYQNLGPYIKVKVPTKEITTNIKTCSNTACKIHKQKKRVDDPFCSKCGSKSETKTFSHFEQVSLPEQPIESLSRVFTPDQTIFDGYIYLISGDGDKNPRDFVSDTRDEGFSVKSLSAQMQEEEVVWMKEAFKKELVILKEWAKNSEVSVEWGLINYYN
jgi:hypothetical protein